MPRPPHPPRIDLRNNTFEWVQIMKLPATYFVLLLLPLRSIYSPQNPVIKHPQCMSFRWSEKPSFTPIIWGFLKV
jgi:hypothetical protein